ncbi:helix-turn-helix transcriptional regulator [Enterococcus gallinarum]|nr:helix-turn-helix transcriptional regulator [Enterococcus gallinarum]MCW3744074.1 helix-turn-helix transcriptional regulator [Enterococcus gallinarum]
MEREVINHFSIRGGTQIDIRRSFFIGYIALPIQILREGQALTQKEVSQQIDVSLEDYLDYEAGDRLPDVMTILHLAAFYDVSVDYILGQTENMQRYPLS